MRSTSQSQRNKDFSNWETEHKLKQQIFSIRITFLKYQQKQTWNIHFEYSFKKTVVFIFNIYKEYL